MDKNMTESPEQGNYFVAFLDILGFKDMVSGSKDKDKDEDVEAIYDLLVTMTDKDWLRDSLNKELDAGSFPEDGERMDYNDAFEQVEAHLKSDSIVVSVWSEVKNALYALIYVCRYLQCRLYDLETPVLLRGSIVEGEFHRRSDLGKAVVDAYVAQEKNSIYPRIIVRGDLVNENLNVKQRRDLLCQDSSDRYYYIDNLKKYFEDKSTRDQRVKRIRGFINGHIDSYEPENVREKYIWLDEDLERVLSDKIAQEAHEKGEMVGYSLSDGKFFSL